MSPSTLHKGQDLLAFNVLRDRFAKSYQQITKDNHCKVSFVKNKKNKTSTQQALRLMLEHGRKHSDPLTVMQETGGFSADAAWSVQVQRLPGVKNKWDVDGTVTS